MNDNKSFFSLGTVLALVLVIALSFASITHSSFAYASIKDSVRNFFAPFFTRSTILSTTPSSTVPVPLYEPALDYEKAVVEAVKKASPAVVSITVSKNVPIIEQCPGASPFSNLSPELKDFFGGNVPEFLVPCEKGTQLQEVGGGSGVIIQDDGLVLTNKHVVSDEKASYTVFTNDGKKYTAKVLARDGAQDLAVLKIDASGLPTVELGDSDSLALGQTAIAIGNALGEFRNTVSVGVVSGLARTVTAQGGGVAETIQGVIQTDAAINPGNSGGPLLNLRGQMVGINTAIVSGAQNIGFAIPINRAKRDIRSVRASGEIQTPYFGVRYVVVTPELVASEKLFHDYGVIVRGGSDGAAVMPDSPASAAGMKKGDIILEVNGTKIDKENPLTDIISNLEVGDKVQLKIERDGKEMNIEATLAKRPE